MRKRSVKSTSPAPAVLLRAIAGLLLQAEGCVATAAGLAGRADLRLHRCLVAALADLSKLRRFILQALLGLLELAWLVPYHRKRAALHALGVLVEAVPWHLAQCLEESRVTLNDLR